MTHKLHDAEIIGIGIQDENLVISVILFDKSQVRMTFTEPISWNLSPFETQNVILNFYEYDKETLDEKISVYFEVEAQDRDLVLNDGYRMYCYQASVGVDGYIIAKGLSFE